MTQNNVQHNHNDEESTTTKYMIQADFLIDGVVEKPDVVGALFGQTEGLLSDDLDLRELQKGGRVGRIQVSLTIRSGKTKGSLFVPSSLDKVETSILAAAIETVDRIGPCNAKISIKKIEDVREEKRKKIISRASDLLKKWETESSQDSSEIHDEVIKAARVGGISNYGSLPAGPELNSSDTIIVVEGRADIAACLRAGVRNTVAVQGASVPKAVSDLTKKRTTIAFLDGDRGGDLILKELLMYGDVDYVARAPTGKEVEDLKPKEIIEQLSKKLPIEKAGFITEIHADDLLEKAIKRKQAKGASQIKAKPVAPKDSGKVTSDKSQDRRRTPAATTTATGDKKQGYQSRDSRSPSSSRSRQPRDSDRRPYSRNGGDRRRSSSRDGGRRPREYSRPPPPKIPDELLGFVKEIDGKDKQEGIFLNEKQKQVKKVPVEKIYDEIQKAKSSVIAVVFDGIITQRLIDVCQEKNIQTLIGARIAELERRPDKTKIYSFA